MADKRGFSRGAAADFLAERFGGSLREVSSVVVVGLAAGQLLPADNERIQVSFVNLGANDVFIDMTGAPSATRGIRLGPNGGLVSFNLEQDGLLPTLEWNAIATGAGNNVYAFGVRRETRY